MHPSNGEARTYADRATQLEAADRALLRGDREGAAKLLEAVAQSSREAAVYLRLSAVRRATGDTSGALAAVKQAVQLAPNDWLAQLLLGSLNDAVGGIHSGGKAYEAAVKLAPDPEYLSPQLRQQLEIARGRAAAEEEWRTRLEAWTPTGEALDLTDVERERIEEFRVAILGTLRSNINTPQFLIPGIESKEWFDPADFQGVEDLERATDSIRAEFLALAEKKAPELSSRLRGLHAPEADRQQAGRWSMIPLIRNGQRVDEYACHCPQTMKLFERLDSPKLALISPSLYFSVVEPYGRIAPHTGLTNARLIAHWPLIAPGSCGFRVGRETREWVPGTALVFDDMTEHEVWNESDRLRVVLIADLWRPELSRAERAAVTQLMDRRLTVPLA